MLKYYTYVSDAKVDMLLPQIPGNRQKKITREVGIDWKVLSAKQTSEYDNEQHRVHRLQAVESYLRSNEEIGTIEEPASWFGGTLPMAWGPIHAFTDRSSTYEGFTLVWWTGLFEFKGKGPDVGRFGDGCVALGGSLAHVLGAKANELGDGFHGDSALYGMTNTLRLMGLLSGDRLDTADELAEGDYLLNDAYRIAREAGHSMATQNVEFLAKRLAFGNLNYQHPVQVVIGSPLYVALAD